MTVCTWTQKDDGGDIAKTNQYLVDINFGEVT